MPPHSVDRDFPLQVGGFTFGDLFQPARLRDLDTLFRDGLKAVDAELSARYEAYREGGVELGPIDESNLLVEVAPHVSHLVARLFGVEAEWKALAGPVHLMSPLWKMRLELVQRHALNRFLPREAHLMHHVRLDAVYPT